MLTDLSLTFIFKFYFYYSTIYSAVYILSENLLNNFSFVFLLKFLIACLWFSIVPALEEASCTLPNFCRDRVTFTKFICERKNGDVFEGLAKDILGEGHGQMPVYLRVSCHPQTKQNDLQPNSLSEIIANIFSIFAMAENAWQSELLVGMYAMLFENGLSNSCSVVP